MPDSQMLKIEISDPSHGLSTQKTQVQKQEDFLNTDEVWQE